MRLYSEHIECWLGGARVLERPRLNHRGGQSHPRDIDYCHLIGALKRKPGAFARWVLRDAMFPRPVYRQTWQRLAAHLSEREACKTIVGLLVLAGDGHEAQLATELEQLIELDQLPDLLALTALLAPRPVRETFDDGRDMAPRGHLRGILSTSWSALNVIRVLAAT